MSEILRSEKTSSMEEGRVQKRAQNFSSNGFTFGLSLTSWVVIFWKRALLSAPPICQKKEGEESRVTVWRCEEENQQILTCGSGLGDNTRWHFVLWITNLLKFFRGQHIQKNPLFPSVVLSDHFLHLLSFSALTNFKYFSHENVLLESKDLKNNFRLIEQIPSTINENELYQ